MAERRIIHFSGRVQGVGFRQTTVFLARGKSLAGTVRNLDDGRVELLIEGPAEQIDQLLKQLVEHFGPFIRNVEQSSCDARDLPPGIQIGY